MRNFSFRQQAMRVAAAVALAGFLTFSPSSAQDAPKSQARHVAARSVSSRAGSAEERASRRFDALLSSPLDLHDFLEAMPKGADLHNHLSGAIYAESLIDFAIRDGLCADSATEALDNCGRVSDGIPVAKAQQDLVFDRNLVDAFSMRDFIPSAGSGHDHFFDTFAKFGAATKGHLAEMIVEVADRAGQQNEQYMELMVSLNYAKSPGYAKDKGSPQSLSTVEDFKAFRDQLLSGTMMSEAVDTAIRDLNAAQKQRDYLDHCGSAQAASGCGVKVAFIDQIVRTMAPDQVFTQMVNGLELAKKDSRVVAINMVAPEDAYVSMRDYELHMRMLDYLHGVYPQVHITLHAGELAPGLVPPEGLGFHIRDAINLGHAERIGHGVDVMYESDPYALLKEMHARKIMAEICLTSNEVILGVSGKNHPLQMYMKYGVPFAIATDDEGVSRSDMTREYQKAAEEQHLSYRQLKRSARNSLEYSFLPGASLWADAQNFRPQTACAHLDSQACDKFVVGSEKAREQLELEQRFAAFESKY